VDPVVALLAVAFGVLLGLRHLVRQNALQRVRTGSAADGTGSTSSRLRTMVWAGALVVFSVVWLTVRRDELSSSVIVGMVLAVSAAVLTVLLGQKWRP